LFDKGNLKYFMIWIISIALSLGFKIYGFKHSEQLSINYEIVILLVFAPSLIVTMIIILKKLFKN